MASFYSQWILKETERCCLQTTLTKNLHDIAVYIYSALLTVYEISYTVQLAHEEKLKKYKDMHMVSYTSTCK